MQAYKLQPHLVFKCHGRSHAASSVWLMGGSLGGIIITLLLLMINLGLVTEFEHIQSVALPTLLLQVTFHHY